MSDDHTDVLSWDTEDALIVALRRAYPDVDPREESYEQLRDYILKLPRFEGTRDPGIGLLEQIRSLWWWGVAGV